MHHEVSRYEGRGAMWASSRAYAFTKVSPSVYSGTTLDETAEHIPTQAA